MRIADAYSKLSLDKSTDASRAQAAKAADRGKGAAGARHESAADAVKVTLSAQARELSAQASQSFDAAKVDRIKTAIGDGSFKVDSGAIAARIVDGG